MEDSDFTQTETFEINDQKRIISSTLFGQGCILLLLAVLLWFMIGLGMIALKAPAPKVLAALITLVLVAALVGFRIWQIRGQLTQSRFTVGPEGMTQYDGKTAVRYLAWQDMAAAERVKPIAAKAHMVAGSDMARIVGETTQNAASAVGQAVTASVGIVGPGRIEPGEQFSGAQQEAYQAAFPLGEDGRPRVGVTPALVEVTWADGRIGQWVEHFRPDILAQVREQDKH